MQNLCQNLIAGTGPNNLKFFVVYVIVENAFGTCPMFSRIIWIYGNFNMSFTTTFIGFNSVFKIGVLLTVNQIRIAQKIHYVTIQSFFSVLVDMSPFKKIEP